MADVPDASFARGLSPDTFARDVASSRNPTPLIHSRVVATRRITNEQKLIDLNSVEPSAENLLPYLGEPSNHVVAKAAGLARDASVGGLDAALRAAFDRFREDPVRTDPGCTAKLATLQALDIVEYDDVEPFRAAARLFQLEPSYPRSVDTAGPLRIRGALGLVRLRAPDALLVLTDHLADLPIVQSGAARALAEHGDPAGGALVRLRVLAGVHDGEVLTDCLCAMLALDLDNAIPFVRHRLDGRDEIERRAAALALGEMHPDAAFELLRDYFERSAGDDRNVARTALGLLRSDEAMEFLTRQEPRKPRDSGPRS